MGTGWKGKTDYEKKIRSSIGKSMDSFAARDVTCDDEPDCNPDMINYLTVNSTVT